MLRAIIEEREKTFPSEWLTSTPEGHDLGVEDDFNMDVDQTNVDEEDGGELDDNQREPRSSHRQRRADAGKGKGKASKGLERKHGPRRDRDGGAGRSSAGISKRGSRH
jgi:hypothetical protein